MVELSSSPRPVPGLPWIDELERLRITARDFKDLGEYSCSFPTGTAIGKRWRRLEGSFSQAFVRAGGKPRWVIGEYVEHPDPKTVGIKWYRPIIIVKSPSPDVRPAQRAA